MDMIVASIPITLFRSDSDGKFATGLMGKEDKSAASSCDKSLPLLLLLLLPLPLLLRLLSVAEEEYIFEFPE
jgi:hypothetical protein